MIPHVRPALKRPPSEPPPTKEIGVRWLLVQLVGQSTPLEFLLELEDTILFMPPPDRAIEAKHMIIDMQKSRETVTFNLSHVQWYSIRTGYMTVLADKWKPSLPPPVDPPAQVVDSIPDRIQ